MCSVRKLFERNIVNGVSRPVGSFIFQISIFPNIFKFPKFLIKISHHTSQIIGPATVHICIAILLSVTLALLEFLSFTFFYYVHLCNSYYPGDKHMFSLCVRIIAVHLKLLSPA